jgi:hypothetical protein
VLEPVAKLVEERLDLAECHQAGLVADRRRLVADEIRHGHTEPIAVRGPEQLAAVHTHVHPGAAVLFLGTRERVQVKAGDDILLAFLAAHVEVPHVLVPDLDVAIGGFDGHAKELGRQAEEPVEHLFERKVGLDLFVRKEVLFGLELLGPVAHIPRRERLCLPVGRGVRCESAQVFLGHGQTLLPQFFVHLLDLGDARRHLLRQAHFCKRLEAQQRRHLLAELQDLADDAFIVKARAAARARDGRTVQLLPQRAVRCVLHELHVRRRVQRNAPWPVFRRRRVVPIVACALRKHVQQRVGQTAQLMLVRDDERERLGRVQQVGRELGALHEIRISTVVS